MTAWTPPASDAVSAWTPPQSDAVEEKKFSFRPPQSFMGRAGSAYAESLDREGYKSPLSWIEENLKARATEWRAAMKDVGDKSKSGEELLTTGPFADATKQAALGFMAPGATGEGLKALAVKGARPAASTAAEIAHEAGYVLPPSSATAKPGTLASMMESLGGEAKTAQSASTKNQAVTNRIAAKELGLPEGTMLTDEAFEGVRGKAATAYKAVGDAGVHIKQDMEFVDDLLKLGPQSEEMAKYFPEMARNDLIKSLQDELGTGQTFSAKAGIQAVRRLRAKATANLKNFLDPDKVELGKAQRGAAEAIDDLIERNLTAAGKPDLVEQYRAARQLIAKSHDVESVTNTASGNVNAHGMAKLADKGKPLTGGLKLIADTAKTFPKATQNPEKFGGLKRWSAVDAIAALAATHGHPSLLAGIVARPAAREVALSRLMQNRLASPKPVPPANSLAAILRPTQQVSQPIVPTYGHP